MSDISTQIETDSSKAKRMKAGQHEKENRSLDELIAADKYLSAKTATGSISATVRGIVSKMVPPGGH